MSSESTMTGCSGYGSHYEPCNHCSGAFKAKSTKARSTALFGHSFNKEINDSIKGVEYQSSIHVPFLSARQKNVSPGRFQQLLILACGACMAVRSQVGLILNRRVCGSPVGCLLYHFWSQQRSCDWRTNSISLLRACRPLPNPCVDLLIASDNPMQA